jgi:hypothetical protein
MEARPCTCHVDDRPPVCQRRYETSACQQTYRELADWLLDDTRFQLFGRGASAAGGEDALSDVQLLRAGVPVDAPPSMGDPGTPAQRAALKWHCWKAYRGW